MYVYVYGIGVKDYDLSLQTKWIEGSTVQGWHTVVNYRNKIKYLPKAQKMIDGIINTVIKILSKSYSKYLFVF